MKAAKIAQATASVRHTADGGCATSPLPVYVIFGTEDYLRLRALERTLDSILGKNRDSMNLVEFDGESASLCDVLDEVRTPSLFVPIRVVIVREADDFVSGHHKEESEERDAESENREAESEDREAKSKNRKALERYLESPCPTGVLILVCKSWPSGTRLYKTVDKLGGNINCKPPEKRDLPAWLNDHARKVHGCALDAAACRRLIDLVGSSLGQLDMELGKLATYVFPKKSIAAADVEELVGASRMKTVFGITDCIARRDAKGALVLWEQVLNTDRAAPHRAVGGLAFGFRQLAEAKRLVEQGLSVDEAAHGLKIWTDPPRLKSQLARFSLPQWRGHLVTLLRIDVGSKTGLTTAENAVERFIVELCAAG